MYELQGRQSLLEGDWETIQRIYGDNEFRLPEDTPHWLFRLQSLY